MVKEENDKYVKQIEELKATNSLLVSQNHDLSMNLKKQGQEFMEEVEEMMMYQNILVEQITELTHSLES